MEPEHDPIQAGFEVIIERLDQLALTLNQFSRDLIRMQTVITSGLERLDTKLDKLMGLLQDPERRFREGSDEETESKPS